MTDPTATSVDRRAGRRHLRLVGEPRRPRRERDVAVSRVRAARRRLEGRDEGRFAYLRRSYD